MVSRGPYRLVRHPGCASLALFDRGAPLALGSWWAVLPHVLVVVLFVRRARLEDRMLQRELAGYRDYAQVVCHRLVPGIW